MPRYLHANPDSGVVAYQLRADGIEVTFRGGARYLYTVASAGAAHIGAMTALAIAGKGLATYISQHVKDAYARKWE